MQSTKRSTSIRVVVPVIAIALAGLGCEDATAPQVTVGVHIAHAAPGASSYGLSVDGDVLADGFDAGDGAFVEVQNGKHTISLEAAEGDVVLEPTWNVGGDTHTGYALLDAADPRLVTFDAPEGTTRGRPVRVINGFAAQDTMTITLDGGSHRAATVLGYGASVSFGLQTGTYQVSAYFDDPESEIELGEVTIDTETRFMIVGPNESGTEPGLAVAF